MLPGGLLLFAAVLLMQFMPPGRGFETAIQFACYATIIVGCLLAWRFSSTRVFCLLLVLALALQPISGLSSFAAARVTMALVAVLLPVNFVVFSFLPERGFTLASIPIRLGILVADFVAVGVTGRPYGPAATNVGWSVLSPVNILFAIAFAIFALRLVHYRRPVESGFLWSLLAILLGLLSGNRITATAYLAVAALILCASLVETSYFLAYHDELTGLPSRRAFREHLRSRSEIYSLAAIDVDHFKSFNDRYGHDTGDQVLRMVASRLANVTGGGAAYRVGGEEFAVLFRGKSAQEAFPHLDLLRQEIEASVFRVRTGERRSQGRGSDRRKLTSRTPRRMIRAKSGGIDTNVTISIGVAEANVSTRTVDQVIEAADQALYVSKDSGRNCVTIASHAPMRRFLGRRSRRAAASEGQGSLFRT